MVNQLPGDQQQVGINEIRNKINELILSGATVDVSQFPPSNPGEGDLWFDTTLAEIYIYLGFPTNAWIQASNTTTTDNRNGDNFCVAARVRAAVFNSSNNTWYFTGIGTSSPEYIGNSSRQLSILGSGGNFCVTSNVRAAVFNSSNNTWYFTGKYGSDGSAWIGLAASITDNMKISGVNGDFCVISRNRAVVFKSSNNTWYYTGYTSSSPDYLGANVQSIISASNGNFCVAGTNRAAVFNSSDNTWYYTPLLSSDPNYIYNPFGEPMVVESINGNFCVTGRQRAAVFNSSNNTWYYTAQTNAESASYIYSNFNETLKIEKGIDPLGID